MMRERVTNTHGKFTFESAWLTEPGSVLQKQAYYFDMEPVEVAMRQQNADYGGIVVEEKDV